MILALDPGTTETGVCYLEQEDAVIRGQVLPNWQIVQKIHHFAQYDLAVEMMVSYGMPVGDEVFQTCIWSGRFIQAHAAAGGRHRMVRRSEVKAHICKTTNAKDSNIRQALINRYGGLGTKKAPGKLYGFKSHMWAALAVGLTALETPGIAVTAKGVKVNVWPKSSLSI